MTELVQSQIAGALTVPPVATDSSTLNQDQQEEKQSFYTEQQHDKSDSDRWTNALKKAVFNISRPYFCNQIVSWSIRHTTYML